MKEFKYLWIFLLTCCYYKVSPNLVAVYHPTMEISRVKQVAQYLIYKAGASARIAGEVTGGTKYKSVQYSINTIQGLIEPGRCQDLKLKRDIDNLLKLI
jgi:chromosomal replication initiation ATPase DnaA